MYEDIILLISVSYLLLLGFLITPSISDEMIYVNMAKVLAEGHFPYKHFFYAHPPLQLFLLAPLTLPKSFLFIKFFVACLAQLSLILVFLISKEIFRNEKIAFLSFLFFLLFPGYIIYSSQVLGIFESLFFFLLGFYLLLKKRLFISSLFFVISLFTRYLIVFLFPLILIYLLKYKKGQLKIFLKYLISLTFVFFTTFCLFFGKDFFTDTVLYHIYTNLTINLKQKIDWYLSFNFFTIFLLLLSLNYGIKNKNFKLILFPVYCLMYDMVTLLLIKNMFYHYFILPLPFVFISTAYVFEKEKNLVTKIFIISIILLALFTNYTNISEFFNKRNEIVLSELVSYIINNTNENETIAGFHIPSNYVSFITDRKIAGNYFDSTPRFMEYFGKEKFLFQIKKLKPKIIFEPLSYSRYFSDQYEIVEKFRLGKINLVMMKIK